MESSRQLDVVSRAAAGQLVILALALVAASWVAPLALAQDSSADQLGRVETLFDEQRWTEIVEVLRASSLRESSAALNYYYGSAAAHLGQWDEARLAFRAGMRLAPEDARFPVELAGVAYRQNRHAEAAQWLRRGLRLDPDDSYANNFLATIYFLNANLEAALKYWNRIDEPQIEDIRATGLRVDPELLDRAFAFAPASLLRLPDFRTTEARVNGLGIFSAHNFQLVARNDGKFDADFRARERNGMGTGTWQAVASTFRGIFWSTAYPEYYNIGRSATNLRSLVRWDAQKRRLFAVLSTPLRGNPRYRLRVGTDLRNENWQVREPSATHTVLDSVNLRREAAEFTFTSFTSGRWTWSTGAEFSHRDYRSIMATPELLQQALLGGYQLKHLAQLDYSLLRLPERRITSTLTLSAQTGTIWSSSAHTFVKLQGGLLTRWLPRMAGEDYATEVQFRYGKTFGQVPFDELHMLGLERDTPLLLRAHRGTRSGRKGGAPMGRNYVLANIESDKTIYDRGLVNIALSPFLDVGKITDPVADLGSRQWLYDIGMQAKFRVWGISFVAIYGKDLRTGQNAYLLTTGR